jgi:hypothetical protein
MPEECEKAAVSSVCGRCRAEFRETVKWSCEKNAEAR